jgi:hypothetical protein
LSAVEFSRKVHSFSPDFSNPKEMGTKNLYIGGVSPKTRERDLEHLFAKYGKIENITLKYGFAFVVRMSLFLVIILMVSGIRRQFKCFGSRKKSQRKRS